MSDEGEVPNSASDETDEGVIERRKRLARERREASPVPTWWQDLLIYDKDGELDEVSTSERIPRHDVEVAEEIIRHFPGDFYAVPTTTKTTVFRRWNGRVWEIDPGSATIFGRVTEFWKALGQALQQIKDYSILLAEKKKADAEMAGGNGEDAYKKAVAAAEKRWKPWNAYWEKLGNSERRNAVVSTLKVNGKVVVEDSQFDTAVGLIVCRNVVLDFSEVKRDAAAGRPFRVVQMPHDAGRLVTQWMNVDYTEGVVPEMWVRYIRQVLPNPAVRWHVQKVLGTLLLGDPTLRLMLNLIGPPASGKSVLINVLEDVLGDYAYFAPVAVFQEDKYAGAERPEPAFDDMRKKKLVVSSEANAFKPYNTALLKGLTGRDKQRSRGLNSTGGTWVPRMLIVIATNDFIRFDINDEAFAKRVHPIEFPMRFRKPSAHETEEELRAKGELDDDTLQRRILESETERTGILNWLIDGLRGYLEEGIAEPQEVSAHRIVMKTTLNSAHDWLQEWIRDGRIIQFPIGSTELPKVYSIGVSEAYEAYYSWCMAEGVGQDDIMKQRNFKRALQQDGLSRPDTGFRRRDKIVHTRGGAEVGNTDVFDRLAWSDWRVRYGVEGP